MNKTIIININSIVFHIEEDAYDVLRNYMIDIKKHFGSSEDSKEILEDIENRIAEMFTEKIQLGIKEVLNMDDVNAVIAQMGSVSDFEINDTDQQYSDQKTNQAYSTFRTGKKLMRDPEDKVISGVCSGLGHYFGIEARWIRLLFVLFVVIFGSGFLVYIILWIVMPIAITRADRMEMRGESPNIQNFKRSFEEELSGLKENFSGAGNTFNRGVENAGTAFGEIIKIFAKVIGLIVAFSIGLSLISLLIALIFFSLGIAGVTDRGIIEPLNLIDPLQAPWALTAAFLAIAIPFAGLFYLIIRLLFDRKPMNNYLTTSLFLVWLISLGSIIYYAGSVAKDFREESMIVEEKPLAPRSIYRINARDVRVIKINGDHGRSNLKIRGTNLSEYLQDDIRIRFERVDSTQMPYIKYEYSAKGANYNLATKRASAINYKAVQDSANIIFDSHFKLGEKELYRDQKVNVTIYLPVGAKVMLNRDLERNYADISYWECYERYENDDIKETEWVMTNLGLKCALPEKSEFAPEAEDETDENVVTVDTAVSRKDTIISISPTGVVVETKGKKK
ncbi:MULTISPECIES: PspC domain-containing protein [Sphingobacterium]|uniref:PspC domain-containing protein n=1 Tax=Sphingobacterium kitahiroshimense TaxID=470446 RepID=A0ABV0BUP2_9SPHI|nr:PspC domain-containing protein [Sphingobacterium sp. JUb56]MBB2953224.1 phage shock protein PspC (stress-responsive transcriptional regulator) [Sphingobacterium sp. JUb56]